MCWWCGFKQHIKTEDDCRNLSALIFQQYRSAAGVPLLSIKSNGKKTQIPHSICHDERCSFVAIIASIIGEPPSTGFDESVKFAEKLKSHTVDKKDADESAVLSDSIISAVCATANIATNKLDNDIANRIRVYAAVINSSMRAYITTGPEGSYGVQYLINALG
jgi:hypothetical protein